jgi:DNA-binding response OmpR family regulator
MRSSARSVHRETGRSAMDEPPEFPTEPLFYTRLGQTGTKLVVLAEDDGELREILAQALARDGNDVLAVGTGLELFAALRDPEGLCHGRKPDLVVSDFSMPGLTGIEVLAAIRRLGSTLPVILISAFIDAPLEAEVRRLGATTVFSKPFEVDDLRTAVRFFLDRGDSAGGSAAP